MGLDPTRLDPVTATKKALRVVVADGETLVNAVFVSRSGNDFYLGRASSSDHFSFHESGRFHQSDPEGGRKELARDYRAPADLVGPHELVTFGLPEARHSGIEVHGPTLGSKRREHVIYLDTREVPKGACLNVTVGVVRSSAIGRLAVGSTGKYHSHEVHLIPSSVEPWLFIEVGWPLKCPNSLIRRWKPPPDQ